VDNYYYSFNNYLRKKFKTKVHRISLNAGFSCPNKDGTQGVGGCIFCNEKGFSTLAKNPPSLKEQIETGIHFAKKRYKAGRFIAYFQNATNTYARVEDLKRAYDTIGNFRDIVGLFISTRPDSIDEKKLDLIESYADRYETWIEYGVQSIHDKSLRMLKRSHTFLQSLEAIEKTAERNIKIGAHVILGLPGETEEDMMKTAETLAGLPIRGVKFHVLHVLRNTKLETMYENGKIKLLEPRTYVKIVCNFLERLSQDCVILRLVSDARGEVLVGPQWINEKSRILREIEDEFKRRNTRQGARYAEKKSMCIR